MGPEPRVEVIAGGRGEPLADVIRRRLRGRPRLLAVLVLVAATVATVAGVVTVRAVRGPGLPGIVVTAGDPGVPAQDPWQPAPGGRPAAETVVVAVSVSVRLERPADVGDAEAGAVGPMSLVGIAGPGVVLADNPVVRLPADGEPVTASLRPVVRCPSLPAAAAASADGGYGLRVTAGVGSSRRSGVLDAGRFGERWGTAIRLACGSWWARRDLTVTAVTARVHPTLPRLDLDLTVSNAGDRQASVSAELQGDPYIAVSGALPLRVPPHATATAAVTVTLDRCDAAVGRLSGGVPWLTPTLSTLINLVALAGPSAPAGAQAPAPGPGGRPVPAPVRSGDGEGYGPTGLVLTAAAAADLQTALGQACGGLGQLVSIITPGSVRFDPATREVVVPLLLDLTPGRVRSLTLRAEPAPGDPEAYRPLWDVTGDLVPDRTGQVRTVLRYRVPGSGSCPERGGYLTGFVATLRVPDAAGERVVAFSGFADLTLDPTAVTALCGTR